MFGAPIGDSVLNLDDNGLDQTRKVSDAIAAYIQQLILDGALLPGDRLLSERDLSAKFDVSRASLREAIEKLLSIGLLTANAEGVISISEPAGKRLRDPLVLLMEAPEARIDCLELRLVVETAATAFAAERATDEDREGITKHFEALVAAHETQDVDQIAKTDADFHLAVYKASHNLMILDFMHSLENILRSNVHLNRKYLYEHSAKKAAHLQEHKAIYDALMARDPPRASEAAREHITAAMQAQRDLSEEERRLGGIDPPAEAQ